MGMSTEDSYDILKRCNLVEEDSNTLGILVIGSELLTKQLCEMLKNIHSSKSKQKLLLVFCAKIEEVIFHVNNLCVDYVVFLLDLRQKACATDVDYNLQRMDKSFLCGRTCIVNANPKLPYSEINTKLTALLALKRKYEVPLLNSDVMDPNSCKDLAERILRLIERSLGVQQKLPFLPWLLSKDIE